MVNFNNDSTITKPPIDIVNLIIIEHWYNCRLAYEFYIKNKFNNAGITLADFRSRLISLYLSIIEILKRKLTPDEFENVNNICMNIDSKLSLHELLEAYLIINRIGFDINIFLGYPGFA
jgi:hypothetical protein